MLDFLVTALIASLIGLSVIPWLLIVVGPFIVLGSGLIAISSYISNKLYPGMLQTFTNKIDLYRPLRVLIVDDNQSTTILLRKVLDGKRCVTTIANSGAQAIAKLSETEFDLIVMDYMMPEMTGPQMLRNADDKLKTADVTPVVEYSSGSGVDLRSMSFANFKVIDSINKKLGLSELSWKLQVILNQIERAI